MRRGAPPKDAVLRMEHFHVTAAEKRRREAMQRSRGRLVIAAGMFAALFAVVCFRVAWVTVLRPVPARIARESIPPAAKGPLKPITDIVLPGQRAMIVDRTGQPLAISQPTREAFADPTAIGDPADVVRKLKTILPRLDAAEAVKRLSDTNRRFVYIERQITPDEEARINNLGIPSLDFRQTQQRNYPLGRIAAHVIGGVDIDQNGVAGVELAFDKRLKDNGEPLRLSIDTRIENVVREELLAAKQEFDAIGAAGIVMDVNTGELLAIVSLPDYDANDFGRSSGDDRFDRAISGRYEPGSTFKLQTLSMALDNGVVHIWDTFDALNPIHIGRFTITDFEGKLRSLALPEVLAYSSNLGAARIAHLVGGERQRAWLRNMGMFDRVPVELHEADRPQFHSESAWGEAVNYTVGFGHGISVTPLHVVAGTAAVANGGVLLRPTILAREPDQPPEGTRVMQTSTSNVMRRLMRLVVTSGFGKKAEVPGYFPGGKTGTAEKNSGHGYKKHANVSAFMSVFPMQAPRYAVYMMLDEPHGNASTGGYSTAGQVAAPSAGRVISRIGPILGLMPDIKDAPEIEAALAIPLQPPRGMTLGPIQVAEPKTDPVPHAPSVLPARIPVGPPQPDLLHKTQAVPLPRNGPAPPAQPPADAPGARTQRPTQAEQARPPVARAPATAPARVLAGPARPDLLHRAEAGASAPPPAEPAPPPAQAPGVPSNASRPDWMNRTDAEPRGRSPATEAVATPPLDAPRLAVAPTGPSWDHATQRMKASRPGYPPLVGEPSARPVVLSSAASVAP
jgi:cell division protein FtsI (penicillin-binding protein 3)